MTPARAAALLWRLGWRNMGRNPRRTALTGAAIVLGVGLCIAMFGICDGLDQDMVNAVTRADLGEVQAHRPGYRTRRSLTLTMPDGERLADDAARATDVVAATPRAYGWAFASHGARSVGVQIMGVDPKREAQVTTLPSKVVTGAFLDDKPTPWPESRELTAEEQKVDEKITADETQAALAEIDALGGAGADKGGPTIGREDARRETHALVEHVAPAPLATPPALLGYKLATRLHVRVGDEVALLGQAANGSTVDATLRVVGTFETDDDAADQARIVMHLSDVQHLLALGDAVHEIAIRTDATDRAPAAAASIASRPAFAGLEVEPWQTLRPDLLDMLRVDDVFTEMIVVIVFLVAGLGVANTMLMAVFDRRREFGVLRALGMTPGTVVAMVAIETVILATAAALFGAALGLALDVWLVRHGLDLRAMGRYSVAGVAVDPVMHAAITRRGVVLPVAAMTAVAALAALLPAVAAARIRPAVGMRDA